MLKKNSTKIIKKNPKRKWNLKAIYNLVFLFLNLLVVFTLAIPYIFKIKLQNFHIWIFLISLFFFLMSIVIFIIINKQFWKKEAGIKKFYYHHKWLFIGFLIAQILIFILTLSFLISLYALNNSSTIRNIQIFFIAILLISLILFIIASICKQIIFTLMDKTKYMKIKLIKDHQKKSENQNLKPINNYLDSTLLNSDASNKDIKELCLEANKYHFYGVCVHPYYVDLVKSYLLNSQVKIISVIGFPLGANLLATKIFEVKNLVSKVDELDVVINLGALKNKNYDYLFKELDEIRKLAPNIILKAIIEVSLLSKPEIFAIVKIINMAGFDYVKTATGFTTKKTTCLDVINIKKAIAELKTSKLKIKASAGIYTYSDAKMFLKLGVSRIGTSKARAIFEEENLKIVSKQK